MRKLLHYKGLLEGVRRTRPIREIHHLSILLRNSEYRATNREARIAYKRFCSEFGGLGLSARVSPPGQSKKALVHHVTLPYAGLETIVEKALQIAGFECVPFGARSYDFLRYDWLVGNQAGHLLTDFDGVGDPKWVAEQVERLSTTQDWLGLTYKGVRVGQFVIASTLRMTKVGRLDFSAPEVRRELAKALNASVCHVIGGERLLDEVQPACILMMDRGYSGAGELFDLALQRGIDIVTWNFGYKSNRLSLKRYNPNNDRDHPLSPSEDAWERIRALPWSRADGDAIRQEIFDCYENGDLFSFVGTQFNKRILSRDETRRQLGLSTDKKVAVIYPHILWDGSFFYGEDIFDDYTEWLVETIKAACANDSVQWVVKLHPAHVVKAEREKYHGKPAELVALEEVVSELPAHITLIAPEAPISTHSLMQIADYVVTVRGTVGIEAALLGIPAVTAGTGRYDRRGFTLDSSTRDEYRSRLANLQNYPPLTEAQVALAERYAYYVFLSRPLRLKCASLEYARDGKATPIVTVHCQTPEQWATSPDMVALASWLRNGTAEDFVGAPFPSNGDRQAPPVAEKMEA